MTYWNNLLNLNLDEIDKNKIQQILKEFSRKIDTLIQFLTSEIIQVKSENYQSRKHAFFNYHISDNSFKILYEESRRVNDSYESFVEYIFQY